MPILGLIPARSGSKGIPHKNMKQVAGKPLLQHAIETCIASGVLDRVVVSTDDERYAESAKSWGAEVPFLRSHEFAKDDTTDKEVAVDFMNRLAAVADYEPHVVVWVRPTSPLRKPEDISRALQLLQNSDCDVVRSIHRVKSHPYWTKTLSESGRLLPFIPGVDETLYPQRQALPPAYLINGLVDVISANQISANKQLFSGRVLGYEIEPWRGLDIDQQSDLVVAEALFAFMESNL